MPKQYSCICIGQPNTDQDIELSIFITNWMDKTHGSTRSRNLPRSAEHQLPFVTRSYITWLPLLAFDPRRNQSLLLNVHIDTQSMRRWRNTGLKPNSHFQRSSGS